MILFLRLTFLALVGSFLIAGSSVDAQESYRIRSGDVLRVEVIEDPDLNRSVLVSPDGRISLPLAGPVRASGRTIEQVQASLSAGLSPNFANPPTVFVSVERLRERIPPGPPAPDPIITIFAMGETANKGKVELTPGTTLLQAFAQIGGFTNFAATRRIQLRRGGVIYEIDYDAIMSGASTNGDVAMAEGDVILAPQRRLFE